MSTEQDNQLTPEQVENWRNVLLSYLGPYALIMPEKDVNKMKNVFQEKIDYLSTTVREEKECPFSVGDNIVVKCKVTGNTKGKGIVTKIRSYDSVEIKWSFGGRANFSSDELEKR